MSDEFPVLEIDVIARSEGSHYLKRICCALALVALIQGCASPPSSPGERMISRAGPGASGARFNDGLLSATLQRQMGTLGPGDFLPVVIRLDSKAELHTAAGIASAADKRQQRAAVMTRLRDFTAESQANILVAARQLEADGFVRNIEPFWLANVICLEATAEAVSYLSEFQEIAHIAGSANAPIFLGEPSWSVRHINSPDVWQRAAGEITGDGVTVAVLDSGADLEHPDLVKRLWINAGEDLDGDGRLGKPDENGIDDDGNGFVDDVVGWDFEAADNDPRPNLFESGRARGHGTHVAGIIAGDGSGGIATGVAPGARLMILKVNSQRSTWSAMQYALANGADILNLSIGWPRSLEPDLATWRDVVDNLADAGVLVVTGAGSGGEAPLVHSPAPDDITTPGRVPRALTVGTVGAPVNHAWLDPVAGFSSTGPVSWQSVNGFGDYPYPPGLMKPDLAAPGVDIRSTMPGGGYATKSGTSMAVAHVSGVAALLLQNDPALQPHDLVFQLRETAWRYAGPNEVRGWGRIDALSAVDYRSDSSPYDLLIDKGDRNWRTESLWIDNDNDGKHDEPVPGSTNRIFARVQNTGGQPVGNAELRFYYAEAGTVGAVNLATSGSGNPFKYIGSYFFPVIGPAGSSQDTFTGAVEWVAPRSGHGTNHWSVAVQVITPTPPNPVEANAANNVAVRNFFDMELVPGQASAFWFYVYADPDHPEEPFNLNVLREGLPEDFDVELSFGSGAPDAWIENLQGFATVTAGELAELPSGAGAQGSARLLRSRGQLERVVLDDGNPVLARLVLRVPEIDSEVYSKPAGDPARLLTISASNDYGTFGGFSLGVAIDPDATRLNNIIYAQK